MLTVEVMLRIADGATRAEFDAAVAQEADGIGRSLRDAQLRLARNVIQNRDEAERAGQSMAEFDEVVRIGGLPPSYARVPLDSFDAVVEIRLPEGTDPDTAIATLDGLVGRLGPVVDPVGSCVLMGVEHTIIAGDGPVLLFYCFRRIPSVSHDEFIEYWRNTLIEQTTKTPSKTGYIQLHVDPTLSARAAKAAGVSIDDFDGVALEWYPDMDGFMSAVNWASAPRSAIIESESNINDFKSAQSMVAYTPDARLERTA